MSAIEIFVTGGTFDKDYDEIEGTLYFKNSHVPEMLKVARCRLTIGVRTLMLKDSLHMTGADRKKILTACRRSKAKRIIITHGTDTLVKTAVYLGKVIKDKTVILTGAMVPHRFGSSDGFFNLGNALAFVQMLPPGVHVVMNGKRFPYDGVRKDKKRGVFKAV